MKCQLGIAMMSELNCGICSHAMLKTILSFSHTTSACQVAVMSNKLILNPDKTEVLVEGSIIMIVGPQRY